MDFKLRFAVINNLTHSCIRHIYGRLFLETDNSKLSHEELSFNLEFIIQVTLT
jgi:hypothetical protein